MKYNIDIEESSIKSNLERIINQTYKLLPRREEGEDWEKPLSTLIEELAGMDRLFVDQHDIFFPLLCKMEGLFTLTQEHDFLLYRRTIFECLGMINEIKEQCLK